MSSETIMITGAMGCIGAWAVRHLVNEDVNIIATDLSTNPVRPRLLMSEDEISAVQWLSLDVTDAEAVNAVVADNSVTHIIHLAGLQVPFCKANPPLGAAVNVVGTVNILEAVRHNNVRGLAYASSLAAFGPSDLYTTLPVPDDAETAPTSLYGVYKVANEETARIYWQDWQVGSIGLRPYNVYGAFGLENPSERARQGFVRNRSANCQDQPLRSLRTAAIISRTASASASSTRPSACTTEIIVWENCLKRSTSSASFSAAERAANRVGLT